MARDVESGGRRGIRQSVKNASVKKVTQWLRGCMLLNATILLTCAFVAPLVGGVTSPSAIFLCGYSVIFGVVICCTEIRTEKMKVFFMKYTGFLFHYKGRIFFLLFLACLVPGLQLWGYITMAVTILNLVTHCLFIKWHEKMDFGMEILYSGETGITTKDVAQHYGENKEAYDSAAGTVGSVMPDSVKESAKRQATDAAIKQAKADMNEENPW